MKIIFSRKGFDSSSGGVPSPIFPDGSMLSLPIPDKRSGIRYKDIRWQEKNLGRLVSSLTGGKITANQFAHLDPDINIDSLTRHKNWKPIFGQSGAAQGHLRNHAIQQGDIFVFFGLYQQVLKHGNKFNWDKQSSRRHVIWGWMQIDEIVDINNAQSSGYDWARYHPHFNISDLNNTLYIASKKLNLADISSSHLSGSGVFSKCSERLILTDPQAKSPTQWKLPGWFFPVDGESPLTYHSNMDRWKRDGEDVYLDSVYRGQEFILDTDKYPQAISWLHQILIANLEV